MRSVPALSSPTQGLESDSNHWRLRGYEAGVAERGCAWAGRSGSGDETRGWPTAHACERSLLYCLRILRFSCARCQWADKIEGWGWAYREHDGIPHEEPDASTRLIFGSRDCPPVVALDVLWGEGMEVIHEAAPELDTNRVGAERRAILISHVVLGCSHCDE